jgi:hypothetical protein
MKRFLMLLLCAVPLFCHATNSDVVIDKENCTITKDGETFPLYGRVKIVDDFADSCGRITIVDDFADIRVKLVDSFVGF